MRFHLLLLLTIIAFPSSAPSEKDAEPGSDVFDHERFCVTIWPERTRIKENEYFDVKVRVVNSSQKIETITYMSCSFPGQWRSSNPRIRQEPLMCFSNVRVTQELKPGDVHEKALKRGLSGKSLAKTESFKLGFTSLGEKKTYWSNEVVIGTE